jgi:hypothetical protein
VRSQKWGQPDAISPEKNPPIVVFVCLLAVPGWDARGGSDIRLTLRIQQFSE